MSEVPVCPGCGRSIVSIGVSYIDTVLFNVEYEESKPIFYQTDKTLPGDRYGPITCGHCGRDVNNLFPSYEVVY